MICKPNIERSNHEHGGLFYKRVRYFGNTGRSYYIGGLHKNQNACRRWRDRKATTIVDKDGNFAHCVPIHHKAAIEQFLTTGSMKPTVRYGLKITVESNYTYKVDWQIQEKGGEVDGKPTKSIWLYSFIDRYGNFSAPFRIYSIGKVVFYREKPELELERNGGVLPNELVKQIYADL